MTDNHLWGIHMDVSIGTLPIDKGFVSIGWSHLGDLNKISPNRDALKEALLRAMPTLKPGSVPVQAGIIYRFLNEVKDGDFVVYPSKIDRMVNIGRFIGGYHYDTKISNIYPNCRKVEWLKQIPREEFSQDALYEIGSFITLFSVRVHTKEFLDKINEDFTVVEQTEIGQFKDDTTVSRSVALQAEETTQDFIIRQLKSQIDPYEFEVFCAQLLRCMGYNARVTPKSGDGGVDIIAHKDLLGFEPPVIKVQCKQTTEQIGRPAVTQLFGNVESGEHALFMTLGSYSKDAKVFERSKPNLRLIDGEQMIELIFSHYHMFDPKYQSLLPLKRIYVPSLGDN